MKYSLIDTEEDSIDISKIRKLYENDFVEENQSFVYGANWIAKQPFYAAMALGGSAATVDDVLFQLALSIESLSMIRCSDQFANLPNPERIAICKARALVRDAISALVRIHGLTISDGLSYLTGLPSPATTTAHVTT